jgi:hypothetical protein
MYTYIYIHEYIKSRILLLEYQTSVNVSIVSNTKFPQNETRFTFIYTVYGYHWQFLEIRSIEWY